MYPQPFQIKPILETVTNAKNDSAVGDYRDKDLFEFRVLLLATGRQSGVLFGYSKYFNPTTDLYVSFNNNVTEMFAAKYSYPINCINLHNGRLDDMIRTMVDANIETVYIDVGPSSFFDGRNVDSPLYS